ncbi:class I SAM-dependent methyltransferase [Pseudokineococcus lusitanus]|uniref:site-specific DNA-methyltransferase (adenine-specific) n=1 Tax=Pseudokineococcus lusitanus TaxID=763993 RepID=A0A3N1GWN1_9ACTN|nr:class I SAM-dependent methyltransferase [Pseudokineococcus lusitanus]ROP34572.1 adenine-specific DNA methylase [Pseudokineococcus lusitanus]
MQTFAAKAEPVGDKLRGGYYTPDDIARYVADWVLEAGSDVLEPACGDGAILRHLIRPGVRPQGIELFPDEARKARATGAPVVDSDFFRWFEEFRHGTYDGVAGNPPYIRFGSWEHEARDLALAFLRRAGMRPSKLTNAWVPFVAASVMAVREGGRVGLVLPAELLQVGYAAQLRAFLVDMCSDITIVSFEKLIFPGILQEVVLLLAVRGKGPASINTVEVADAAALANASLETSAARAPLHDTEKWTKYYLGPEAIELVRRLRNDHRLAPLGAYAAVNVGVVTGRNSFFCLTEEDVKRRGLGAWTMPLLARSAQMRGLTYRASDLSEQSAGGARTHLLAVAPGVDPTAAPSLARYIEEGEGEGVHTGFKCRIRNDWWVVPSVSAPEGFMLRQVASHLRIAANEAGATSTDTVHRVFVKPNVSIQDLAVGAFNTVTLAMSEVIGRSYGGGLLEMEPSECSHLPVPDPALVPDGLSSKVDELLREQRVDDALDLVDRTVLVEQAGISPDDIHSMRAVWHRMRSRRMGRSRR